jgi:hypothetical protein
MRNAYILVTKPGRESQLDRYGTEVLKERGYGLDSSDSEL